MNITFRSPPTPFPEVFRYLADELHRHGQLVETGHWQGMTNVPQTDTLELQNINLVYQIPESMEQLAEEVSPSKPWAEEQFKERIGGKPLNPGDTYQIWPWYRGNVERHKPGGFFSHTYMERFWPKRAGSKDTWEKDHRGIRFPYGDYEDVIELLGNYPGTRQAYLPIFFPEDTGGAHGDRVPCTLGYHFMRRRGKLHVNYPIRSCDLLRHFRDDVYMAARLAQHTIHKLWEHDPSTWESIKPGYLSMMMFSLHVFAPERATLLKVGHHPAADVIGGPT